MKEKLKLKEEAQVYFKKSASEMRECATERAKTTKQLKRFLFFVCIVFSFFAYETIIDGFEIGAGIIGFISVSFIIFTFLGMTLPLVKVSSMEIAKSWKKLDALNLSRLNT